MISESTTLVLPGDAHLPLYRRLAQYIQDSIAHQRWSPGERLPSESEFAAQLGLAVGTVRQALANLVSEGLLVRHQGKGTFVNKASFDNSLFRFWRFYEQGSQRPESRILQLRKIRATSEVRERLQLKKNENAVFIRRLRLGNQNIIVAEEIWLPQSRFAPLLKVNKENFDSLLYPAYESVCGQYIANAEEWLSVHTAAPKHAKLLDLKAGAPIIVISRLARGYDGTRLEWRTSRGCISKFQYHIEIR